MKSTMAETEMSITIGQVSLPGTLTTPSAALGVVVFAHGSGSSRLSPRNVAVAQWLADRSCATFLFDLLTPEEVADRRNVFDIDLLADRMVGATQRLRERGKIGDLPLGYFGASTGAAAALVAAANLGTQVSAVVSRGGRPDLAGAYLPRVTAPTLLLVGSHDFGVIELNEQAARLMRCEKKLVLIEGATHLFEEPGTLEEVGRLAGDWFVEHFAANRIR